MERITRKEFINMLEKAKDIKVGILAYVTNGDYKSIEKNKSIDWDTLITKSKEPNTYGSRKIQSVHSTFILFDVKSHGTISTSRLDINRTSFVKLEDGIVAVVSDWGVNYDTHLPQVNMCIYRIIND